MLSDENKDGKDTNSVSYFVCYCHLVQSKVIGIDPYASRARQGIIIPWKGSIAQQTVSRASRFLLQVKMEGVAIAIMPIPIIAYLTSDEYIHVLGRIIGKFPLETLGIIKPIVIAIAEGGNALLSTYGGELDVILREVTPLDTINAIPH
jgi:hypothetical protein